MRRASRWLALLVLAPVVPACRETPSEAVRHAPAAPRVVADATPSREPAPAGDVRHFLLVSIDTLRADALGAYGAPLPTSPHLDRLARGGTTFQDVSTSAPITLPAHASLLTGRHPWHHGVRDNAGFRLADAEVTLAELLAGAGFRTGAFVGGEPLVRAGGLGQGFEVYDDALPARTLGKLDRATRPERAAAAVVASASAWIVRSAAPWMAFVHLYDPHSPYEAALPGEREGSYHGEVAAADAALGGLLRGLPAAGRLVVVTSDHGEGLGEHGERNHCIFVYDGTLRVPLIMTGAGVGPGRIVTVPVGVVDVMPTVLEMLRVEIPVAPDGASARGLVAGEPREARPILFESLFGSLRFGWAPLRGVRRGELKYIEAPRPELYALDEDAGELANLAASRPDVASEMARSLGTFAAAGPREEVPDERRERLEALGYVGGSAPSRASSNDDPKDHLGDYERFQEAHLLAGQGRLDEALSVMEALSGSLAASPYFHLERGGFAAQAGRWELAERCFLRALELDPGHERARLNLGAASYRLGKLPEARASFQELLRRHPGNVEGHLYLGKVLAESGDRQGARAMLERAIEMAPDHPQAAAVRESLEKMARP